MIKKVNILKSFFIPIFTQLKLQFSEEATSYE